MVVGYFGTESGLEEAVAAAFVADDDVATAAAAYDADEHADGTPFVHD